MMDTLFGVSPDLTSGPVKRLKWILGENEKRKNPLRIDESFETQLIRGLLPETGPLIQACAQLNVNLDWLFYNRGQPYRSERQDDELREMIDFASQRKEFRYALLAKFYELRALYKS